MDSRLRGNDKSGAIKRYATRETLGRVGGVYAGIFYALLSTIAAILYLSLIFLSQIPFSLHYIVKTRILTSF